MNRSPGSFIDQSCSIELARETASYTPLTRLHTPFHVKHKLVNKRLN